MAVSHKEVSRKYGLTPSEREMKKTLCRWLDIYIEFFFYTSYGFSAFVECVAAPTGGRFRGNGAFRLQAFLRICLKSLIYKNGKMYMLVSVAGLYTRKNKKKSCL